MKRILSFPRLITAILFPSLVFILIGNAAFSQTIIQGKVTGRNGIPLPGATISIKATKGISNLRIYIAGTNLFVITNYDGVDPEINTDGSQRYIDQNYYPKTRGFTFGVNAVF